MKPCVLCTSIVHCISELPVHLQRPSYSIAPSACHRISEIRVQWKLNRRGTQLAQVIAFQKSRSSCNQATAICPPPFVIAFQKSRSSCNRRGFGPAPASVIAFQKSRSSCNWRGARSSQAYVIAFQKVQKSDVQGKRVAVRVDRGGRR